MTETPELDLELALNQWHEAKQKLVEMAPWVEKERMLRTAIFNAAFPNAVRTQNAKKISFGMALVGKPKINWTVDRAALEAGLSDSNLKPLIEEVIRFDPKVKDGAYEELSDESKLALGPILTAKPGLPDLEIRPQKGIRKWTA